MPLTPERRLEAMENLYRQLVATLEEVLPLLGLVLFGDPKIAQRFYRDSFAVAMDRLSAAWEDAATRHAIVLDAPEVSARAVMGIALVVALERHHNPHFDRDRALGLMAARTIDGFFPSMQQGRRGPRGPA